MPRSLGLAAARIGSRHPLLFYLIGVLLVVTGVTAVFLEWSGRQDLDSASLLFLAVPFLMCATHLGIAVVNWLATLVANPHPLPRLDFSEGIPPEHRTMVVVPTMLSNPAAVADCWKDSKCATWRTATTISISRC